MSFNKAFNRQYEMIEFPYFIPKEELAYNLEYVHMMQKENRIPRIWKKLNDIEDSPRKLKQKELSNTEG